MNKSSINRKEIQKFIFESRSVNKSDQEIYNELSLKYYDKKTIALLISGTVRSELREKYKVANTFLLVLIGITILFKLLAVINITLELDKLWLLIMFFLVPLINIYFFYEVYYYNAMVYKIIGILTIASLFKVISTAGEGNMLDIIVSLGLAAGIIYLSFYLSNKLIPNYNPKKLIKDSNGEYIMK
jgi:hypothetical protein